MDICSDLKVAVQVFTKTREETLPTLKKYNKNLTENPSVNANLISVQRTFTEADDPDGKEVAQDKHTKAFYYGKQLVPVSEENEQVLKHKPKNATKAEEDEEEGPKKDEDIKIE